MVADHRFGYTETARGHLATLFYPMQYIANFPVKAGQWLSTNLSSRVHLISANEKLKEENLLLRVLLQKYQDLETENERLRGLLGSSQKANERVLVAEVLSVDLDPFTRKMLINKGHKHGVFEGQPVIDAHGIMGQVLHVNPFSSIIILITDPSHAVPVQVVRTGLRTVAVGMGAVNRLDLLYLPNASGIEEGDVLVTSGLGGQFPPGYPIGKIAAINPDIGRSYAQVHAIPMALLERNREVLLIWQTEKKKTEEVNTE